MNLPRIARKLQAGLDLFTGNSRYSYSQFAEDILIDTYFSQIRGIDQPTYLDIGANKPKAGSNTFYFYQKRCYGVCVEPDEVLYGHFKAARPRDKVIHAGVGFGPARTEAVFYYFPEPYTGWNTFSREDAMHKQQETGVAFKADKSITLIPVNEIIQENFTSCPDFISLDVEGLDYDILQSIDFSRFQPALFCVETMQFDRKLLGKKDERIAALMQEKGYVVFADTYVNTIFVRKETLQ